MHFTKNYLSDKQSHNYICIIKKYNECYNVANKDRPSPNNIIEELTKCLALDSHKALPNTGVTSLLILGDCLNT